MKCPVFGSTIFRETVLKYHGVRGAFGHRTVQFKHRERLQQLIDDGLFTFVTVISDISQDFGRTGRTGIFNGLCTAGVAAVKSRDILQFHHFDTIAEIFLVCRRKVGKHGFYQLQVVLICHLIDHRHHKRSSFAASYPIHTGKGKKIEHVLPSSE